MALKNALRSLTAVLERLRIPYAVGGSVASSIHGVMRATVDIDILARVAFGQVDPLASALGQDWYADPESIRSAISAGRSFNLIYLPSAEKVDVFPATGEFHAFQLERAETVGVQFAGEEIPCPVATPEDVVLAKLQWYQAGGEVSERQWSDIIGVLVTKEALDFRYLASWAARLGVARLLARALEEAGKTRP